MDQPWNTIMHFKQRMDKKVGIARSFSPGRLEEGATFSRLRMETDCFELLLDIGTLDE